MANKSDKLGIDKLIKRFNKEFEKTSSQLDKMVNEALKQFDTLQNQIQEPVKKVFEDMDKLREQELKRFHDEFDRRMKDFNELQNSILEKIGVAPKAEEKKKPASAPKTAPKSAPAKTAPKAATTPKAPAAKPAKAAPTAKKATSDNLTKLKGVGPALAKKLNEAGITSLKQVATPSEAEAKALSEFTKVKGFETWTETAKNLLG